MQNNNKFECIFIKKSQRFAEANCSVKKTNYYRSIYSYTTYLPPAQVKWTRKRKKKPKINFEIIQNIKIYADINCVPTFSVRVLVQCPGYKKTNQNFNLYVHMAVSSWSSLPRSANVGYILILWRCFYQRGDWKVQNTVIGTNSNRTVCYFPPAQHYTNLYAVFFFVSFAIYFHFEWCEWYCCCCCCQRCCCWWWLCREHILQFVPFSIPTNRSFIVNSIIKIMKTKANDTLLWNYHLMSNFVLWIRK